MERLHNFWRAIFLYTHHTYFPKLCIYVLFVCLTWHWIYACIYSWCTLLFKVLSFSPSHLLWRKAYGLTSKECTPPPTPRELKKLAIRKIFLNYHYLSLCVSADEAGGQGRMLGWKCNEVCGTMEQVYSVYTAVYAGTRVCINQPPKIWEGTNTTFDSFCSEHCFIKSLSMLSMVLLQDSWVIAHQVFCPQSRVQNQGASNASIRKTTCHLTIFCGMRCYICQMKMYSRSCTRT